MIFDTHCHYNLDPLKSNWKDHLKSAQNHGVKKSIIVGIDLISSKLALLQASQHDCLYASVAIHPGVFLEKTSHSSLDNHELLVKTMIQEIEILIQETIKSQSKTEKKIVAIGETGLDYYRLKRDKNNLPTQIKIINAQKASFLRHIKIANHYKLPLILHVRDKYTPNTPTKLNAYWDTLEMIENHYHWHKPVVLHCVSGPLNYVKKALSLGAFIGVSGNYTYPNNENLKQLIEVAPENQILVETDAPYLAPAPFRGKVCLPYMIKHTHDSLIKTKGVQAKTLWDNSCSLFLT